MRCAIYKVPEGKLLKVFVETEGATVDAVKITGDFFMHPEEKITELEATLLGQPLDESALQALIDAFLKKEGIELFGADAASISHTIVLASQAA